jgi:hypothetical protein
MLYVFPIFLSFVVAHTKIGGKRNQKTPQSSNPAIVSRKSPRGVSKKLGRSSLSHVDDGNDGVKNAQSALGLFLVFQKLQLHVTSTM